MYKDKQVLLASMHKKEQAIAPVFQQQLGCCLCLEAFDTDQFGTFTGEIARNLNAYDTCVLKAKRAALENNYLLSIASEGSFGPHPANPFLASAHEIMVFVDLEHDWVFSEQLVTTQTNYQSLVINDKTDITAFLKAVQFPEHALTLQSYPARSLLAKGITELNQLQELLTSNFAKMPQLYLGTDMRAMHNPTRMTTLAELAQNLAKRILTPCEACLAPGFGQTGTVGFLPCELCGGDTSRHALEVWACVQCDFKINKPRSDGLQTSEATYCLQCNP